MGIYDNVDTFADQPVEDWEPGKPLKDNIIYRLRIDWPESERGIRWTDRFAEFLDDPKARETTGLVTGFWDSTFGVDTSVIVQALVVARDRLPNLKAIFIGDITSEENEISWINQSDVSALWQAYPNLEYFRARGGNRLDLGTLRHKNLKMLVIETGGMDVRILRSVVNAHLPKLEHLELWLGTDHYGWNGTLDDVKPLMHHNPFPSLRYLGLRDSEIVDQIAQEIVKAPILDQIHILDLSLGILTDDGAAALVDSPAIRKLKKLDLHHHFCSKDMIGKLEALGIPVDVSDVQKPDIDDDRVWRFVAVGE